MNEKIRKNKNTLFPTNTKIISLENTNRKGYDTLKSKTKIKNNIQLKIIHKKNYNYPIYLCLL
jgi:hypothetical protein